MQINPAAATRPTHTGPKNPLAGLPAAAANPGGIPSRNDLLIDAMGVGERRVQAATTAPARAARPGEDPRMGPLRERFADLVAQMLVAPILTEAREANQAPPPFGPTQADKTFGAMADQATAAAIVRRGDWPLIDQLARTTLEQLKARNGETTLPEPNRQLPAEPRP